MSGKWKRYPAYRESGVEWLGSIPSHWALKRLKFVANVRSGAAKGRDFGERETMEVPYLRVANVQDGFLDLTDVATIRIAKAELHRYSLRRGDVLMNEGGDFDKLGRGGVWQEEIVPCVHQNHVFAVRPFRPDHAGWINAITLTYYAKFFFMLHSKQSTNLASISASNIRELPVLSPPEPERLAIEGCLHREMAKIDALVAKKERLIELLQEKRTALISHAVTRGLNPNAPLRDSGIPWIGQIPEHWELKCLRNIAATIQTGPFGSQLHASDYSVGGVPVINPANIQHGRIVPDENCAVTQCTFKRLARHRLRSGDIVFARRGEMGRCGLVMKAEDGWLCGTGSLLVRCCARTCNTWFLTQVLSTKGVREWLSLESVGATMENLNTSILGRVPIASPPLVEQRSIAEHIHRRTTKLDALITKVRTAIDRLQEYRTALISAAVTGQIDVRQEMGRVSTG